MKSSQPQRQAFFMFDKNIDMTFILEVIKYIESHYCKGAKLRVSIISFEETYTDLALDDILNFNDTKDIIDTLSIHLSMDSTSISLIMQFNNDNVGANGNYTIMMSTKEDNLNIEKYIRKKLMLKKYVLNPPSVNGSNEMVVAPIFARRSFSHKTDHCFILMPFTESWSDRVWRHIKQILENEGLSHGRADDLFGHNILEDIWVAINECSFVVADITTKNPNVFYEIGIAHTLGKKVILLTQKLDDIPFDFKNYRHIIYEDNTDGFEILKNELPKYLK